MCIQQVASSTIRVLSAPDTPHFTFDAVVDMSVQQDGVFAGKRPYLFAPASHKSCVASAVCGLQLNTACAHGKQFTHVIWRHRAFYIATNLACCTTILCCFSITADVYTFVLPDCKQ